MANIDLLSFFSGFPIDKIVGEGEISIHNPGPDPTEHGAEYGRVVTATNSNLSGVDCFARAVFRVDNGPWRDIKDHEIYSYTSDVFGTRSSPLCIATIGVSRSEVIVATENYHHGHVSGGLVFPVATPMHYTPIPHTITVKYVLFSVD